LVSRSHPAVEFEIQIEDAAGDRAGVLVIIAANVSFRQLRTMTAELALGPADVLALVVSVRLSIGDFRLALRRLLRTKRPNKFPR
jgi:hypothetical protein